jgi:hypothetical protein
MSQENKDKLKEIISDYEQKEAVSLKHQQDHQERNQKKGRVRLIFQMISSIGIGLLIFQLVSNVLEESGFFRKKVYWNLGGRQAKDNRIAECIFKLWRIRQDVDLHYVLFKEFPEDLKSLERTKLIHATAVCAITQHPYSFKENDLKKTICCPNPELHGVRGICMHWESGPPFVIR